MPKNYLENIKKSGEEVSKGMLDKELWGLLFGVYEPDDDSINASEMYNTLTKIGDANNNVLGNLYDALKVAISLPHLTYVIFKMFNKRTKLRFEGKEIGIISYHTHPSDSWSDKDLNLPLIDIPHAFLLYRRDIDNFQAINEQKESIKIEIINKPKTREISNIRDLLI